MPDPRFEEVKELVRSGMFGSYNYDELMGSLEGNEGFGQADYYLVGKDFPSYIECQEKVDEAYRDQEVSYLHIDLQAQIYATYIYNAFDLILLAHNCMFLYMSSWLPICVCCIKIL